MVLRGQLAVVDLHIFFVVIDVKIVFEKVLVHRLQRFLALH